MLKFVTQSKTEVVASGRRGTGKRQDTKTVQNIEQSNTYCRAIFKQAEVLQHIRKLQEDNDGRKASNQRELRQYVVKGLS